MTHLQRHDIASRGSLREPQQWFELTGRNRVKTIHRATISRFLAAMDIKPHRVREWMNRPEDAEFDMRAENVKKLLCAATAAQSSNILSAVPDAPTAPLLALPARRAVTSFDEKTGMQAKERIKPTSR